MSIPIANIYYLLSYAWNKLDEKDRIKVSTDGITNTKDLLAKILINGTNVLLKRGLDKSYIHHIEDVSAIKGKIQISDTLKGNLLAKQRTVCGFDEYSSDTLLNQILVSSIHNLLKTEGLNKDFKANLVNLKRHFYGVSIIKLNKKHFRQTRIHRNNKFYGFLMNVCELIYDSLLPSENSGHYKFSDFSRDEHKMNQLFEAFIRNFYKIEQSKFNTVKAENINWQLEPLDADSEGFVPLMKTDITLIGNESKIIIDAKYYRETISTHYGAKKIKSNNLYQLFSYLLNQEDGSMRNRLAKGILLYPTVQEEYDLNYQYKDHHIQIKTLNLNDDWNNIAKRLHAIIA